ncbi:NAD-dependent epimerase/dehydratase family protein [Arcticibacterium luteifluviistationis]|uniref:NAD-dependent epimerase n=1 Tax=Arcticibacterium luteifluviistationis TaxID=1784714 RepID=A0A2Z4GAD0_9BACT|nr:NAD-dependent epimerase/dehydratase family protein [Arcticibacterium luteifluviistationis]AWV98050.1 NAD-dependent epimerase [Arcticibacterium luteifluviistationis]
MSKILITGSAGFIGYHLAEVLLKRGENVVGIDSINDYYDPKLKYARLSNSGIEESSITWHSAVQSSKYENYKFVRMHLEDKDELFELFEKEKFDIVINLAAQAGVRYSITHPYSYLQSNLIGFINILEASRNNAIKHLVYASSSSVYGQNDKVPFSEEDRVDNPISLYAATKRSNELMAHSYSKLYNIPCTGLRFFTVYGPWGRPDMAPMLFAKAISNDNEIKVFNNGDLMRDFTFIEDIVSGTVLAADSIPQPTEESKDVPYKIYNIGCSSPVKLMDFIQEIEDALGKDAKKVFLPMQAGDVYKTYADTSKLEKEVGYKPTVSLHQGIQNFISWYTSNENPIK